MDNSQILTTILTKGLETIKESLTRETKSLSYGVSHYTELHSICDDLEYLLEEPLDYIQDIVGYVEDLETYSFRKLNKVEKALVLLSKRPSFWNEVNDLLKLMLPEVTEYKVLNEKLGLELDKF